jgi:hypothetical protein
MIYNIIHCEGRCAMTMNRPRLIAILLCGLIVLTLFYLLASATAPNRYRFVRSPAVLPVMAEPPSSLPKIEYEAAAPPARLALAGPEIAPTAAPGVAFNYRYAFRLPAQRIAAVQERHAQMCERLTVARCRITGMLYRVVDDRTIEAMLALKLDPAIARLFGRQGVEAVVRAEGMLTESEISGSDAAGAIRAAGRSLAELEAELARNQARLGQRLSAEERAGLENEAQMLRGQIRALRESREAQQESLATTPMTFRYGSGDLVPGFAERPTLGQALARSGDNFLAGATMLLIVLVTLLPWLIALALGGWVFRAVWRRLPPPATPAESPGAI